MSEVPEPIEPINQKLKEEWFAKKAALLEKDEMMNHAQGLKNLFTKKEIVTDKKLS